MPLALQPPPSISSDSWSRHWHLSISYITYLRNLPVLCSWPRCSHNRKHPTGSTLFARERIAGTKKRGTWISIQTTLHTIISSNIMLQHAMTPQLTFFQPYRRICGSGKPQSSDGLGSFWPCGSFRILLYVCSIPARHIAWQHLASLHVGSTSGYLLCT